MFDSEIGLWWADNPLPEKRQHLVSFGVAGMACMAAALQKCDNSNAEHQRLQRPEVRGHIARARDLSRGEFHVVGWHRG